ncbi:hypothetical protein [Legionella brunensis]|uniref:Dot/Icm T4SS effector n=1 Tax=Legionella brunensis TaxID=29422 RepID=A0A0W0SNK0_9GAMM|nr:hypothetical protein [Legionella brunensis]KTC84983.1 Dot/Icm T4SS effector [Legionella brunensis]
MPKILIYTDFDGTVTAKRGGILVKSPFYQSLLQGYVKDNQQNYKYTPLKGHPTQEELERGAAQPVSTDEIQNIFKETFGDPKPDYTRPGAEILMTPQAVTFFKEVLNNPDITIKIVTRNRGDYIRELFTYQGFTPEEISRLTIFDSKAKYFAITDDLKDKPNDISHFYVLDDDESDYNAMLKALRDSGYQPTQISGKREEPGNFKWLDYLKDILLKLTSSNEEKKSTEDLSQSQTFEASSKVKEGEPSSQNAEALFDIIKEQIDRVKAYKTSRALYKAEKLETSLADAQNYLQKNPTCTIKEFLNYRKDNDPETFSISQALAYKRNPWDFIHTPKAFVNVMNLFKGRLSELVGLQEEGTRNNYNQKTIP